MPDDLVLTVDKFTFRIATDCGYTAAGVWARAEGPLIRIGVSDFLQQRSGDVAFAEVRPEGTRLAADEEAAALETIKVTIALGSPLSGRVAAVNPALADRPEIINGDPYGAGWLALIEPDDWERDRARLLGAQAYLDVMRRLVAEETK